MIDQIKRIELLDRVEYRLNGQLHRIDGPAVEYLDGYKEWYANGKRHRLDGPAIEWSDGHKEWWVNGKLHRLDGPAVEYSDGRRRYFLEGKEMTQDEYIMVQFLKGIVIHD